MADGDLTARLEEAAKIIAEQAKVNASGWSRQVPPSIKTRATGTAAIISSGAPPAYPNEMPDIWHPVFGRRGTKRFGRPRVKNKHRPFLDPAADQAGDEAMRKFSLYIEDIARKAGFK